MSRRLHPGQVACLPLAAAVTLWVASWLPVSFEYRPNALGIVSAATRDRYPLQQETFWALFAGLLAGALAGGFARALERGAPAPRALVAVELLAAGALVAVLWLPAPLAAPAAAALAAGALALGRLAAADAGPAPPDPGPRPARGRLAAAAALGLAALLAALLAPGVWENLWSVAHRVPDERQVTNHFKFLAETGQHLAWADALRRGGLHGRDFFCLYGPLYDWGVVGFWKLVGRSIAGFDLYGSLTRVLGWISLFALGLALLRRPALVLLLPFLVPWVKLRVGLPLVGLLFLVLYLRSRAAREAGWGVRAGAWSALAGASGGAALLFSQEFGLAFLLCGATAFAVRLDGRGAACFAAGLAALVAPLVGWYALEGALGPMLRDLFHYPAYMLAGYGKLPFPALAPSLPLEPLASRATLELRLGYAVPAVCVAAVLALLPLWSLDPRRPLASLRAVRESLARDPERLALLLLALFGILAFRSALGRSQLARTLAVLPPAALLLACALDRSLDLLRAPALRGLALWRGLALVAFVLSAGFPQAARPIALVESSILDVSALLRGAYQPRGSAQVMRVTRWIQLHTGPDEPVLFLPNDAAYYYLTGRPSPIRFVLGHQMVTDAHRAEVLEALRRRPPRYLVWDHGVLRVDDLSDSEVFGEELLEWIRSRYASETRIGEVEVLRLRDAEGSRPPPDPSG